MREAEALVIGRIANQDDGLVAARACLGNGLAHQRRADTLALRLAVHGEGAQQQGRAGGTRQHVPQAQRADELAFAVERGEGEAFRRNAAFAQALGGLAAALLAEGLVEQALAGGNIGSDFRADGDHW